MTVVLVSIAICEKTSAGQHLQVRQVKQKEKLYKMHIKNDIFKLNKVKNFGYTFCRVCHCICQHCNVNFFLIGRVLAQNPKDFE